MPERTLLQTAIRQIILENTRWQRENVPTHAARQNLEDYIGSNSYVHFSDVNKLGIKPTYAYDTPFGIYGYVLDPAWYKELRTNKASKFGRDRPYAHIFSAKHPDRILTLKSYTEADLARDVEQLSTHARIQTLQSKALRHAKSLDDVLNDARSSAYNKLPGGVLWNFLRMLSSGNTRVWTKIMRDELDYDGVRDDGLGIIHSNEPRQAVFFSAGVIRHEATLVNNASTFNTRSEERATQAIDRILVAFVKALKRPGADEETMRHRMIDPLTRHQSANVRYSAMPYATDAARYAMLADSDDDVRREAFSYFKRDKAVVRHMAHDQSPEIIDDVIDALTMAWTDEDDTATVLDQIRSRWPKNSSISKRITKELNAAEDE